MKMPAKHLHTRMCCCTRKRPPRHKGEIGEGGVLWSPGKRSLLKTPRRASTYSAGWSSSRLFHARSGGQELRRGTIGAAAHRAQTNSRVRGYAPRPVPDVSLHPYSSLDAGTIPGLSHEFAKRRLESEICPESPRPL